MDARVATTLFYGALTGLALVLAWRSRSPALIATMSLLGVCWAADSAVFYLVGPAWEPYIAPSVDVAVAVLIGNVAIQYRSRAAWAVVGVFVLSACAVVAGFLSHHQGAILYYGALNVLYVGRLAVVGGVAVHDLAVGAHNLGRGASLRGLRVSSRRSQRLGK